MVFYESQRKSLEVLEQSPVLNMIYECTGIMDIFSTVVMYFMNFWGSKKVQEIANELLTLEYQDFDGLTKILFIYRYVWTINGQLEELADQLNKNPLTNSSRIRELLSLYQRLLMLSKKLVATYELQMTMTLTVGLAGNIVIIYFLIVFGTSMDSTFMVLSYCVLINIWDFWLNIVVCELTEEAGRNTSTVLKRFTDLKQKDVELERNLNEFAWLGSHRKFRFQLCGFLSINYEMGFQMITTNFLYLIYLVQFDYMNL
nr:putative gustatory receptor 22b [Drosophila suzukii]